MAEEKQTTETKKAPNFKSISGTGVDLYVENASVGSFEKTSKGEPVLDKDGNKQFNDVVYATIRKRRDLAGEKDFGGSYVANYEGKNGKEDIRHTQKLSLDAYNHILEVSGNQPIDVEAEGLHDAENVGKVKSVVSVEDSIAFKGNVFSDKAHPGSHLVNPNPDKITAPSAPFDRANERKLNAAVAEAKAEAQSKKTAKEAAAADAEKDADVEL